MNTMERMVVLLLVLGLSAGCASMDSQWHEAVSVNTIPAYETFLKLYPGSQYTRSAQKRIELLRWKQAVQSESVAELEQYLNTYPGSPNAPEAREMMALLDWENAMDANTLAGYQSFLERYPESQYVNTAKAKLEQLPWQQAVSQNSISAFRRFLQQHPKSPYAKEARRRIEIIVWGNAKRANSIVGYSKFLKRYPKGRYAKQALIRRNKLYGIVAVMQNPIPYQKWGADGWQYDCTVTFNETRGMAANVARLKIRYRDKSGVGWIGDLSNFKAPIRLQPHQSNEYRFNVRGTTNPDLRGGTVEVHFYGRNEQGHPFSGTVSANLAVPKP